jgi:hypothetical protein
MAKVVSRNSMPFFYLFARSNDEPSYLNDHVIYRARGEDFAASICDALPEETGIAKDKLMVHYMPATAFTSEKLWVLKSDIENFKGPRGEYHEEYDRPPSPEVMQLTRCWYAARRLERRLRKLEATKPNTKKKRIFRKGALVEIVSQVEVKRDVAPVCMEEVYDFDLNGNRTRTYCERFFIGEAATPQKASAGCAGHVRLTLHDHSLEFTVLGKGKLKPGRIVRIVTEGKAKVVEFEGGVIREIDCVPSLAFPDHDGLEKSVVRNAELLKETTGGAIFDRLPTAMLKNGWRLIRLPSKKVLDLGGRKLKRSIILEEIWNYCVKNNTLEFSFSTVIEDYNKRIGKGTQIKSSRLFDDSFRAHKQESREMFKIIGLQTNEVYRLKVRFAKPG